MTETELIMLDKNPLWYKDAIIYEVHVRAFHDGIGDGMGDFRGLTQKLDYLQDLGVNVVWLLPFYPSPLKDDGYDIADYCNIHSDYGTLRDFRRFLEAAHERGLRVITELVINHTSDQHVWFQRARRAPPGSVERDFYVWSDTPEKFREARIIFKDFETSNWSWDPVAKAYYWHRFYGHQPDLNYDNRAVWDAIFPLLDFWMEMGVDGMRLDAVPYLYEREGTNCENLPETHEFLKALRRHVDARFPNRMLLAEANQWPEDAVAYFGDGDECHMAFHFPLMPRMFMGIHMEDRFPIIDILAQTPPIHETCQWGMFLRNHDELTLEMVTDEERDYMYRAYAHDPQARINLGIRRRLAPLLGNNRRRIELMKGLLFSLPGTPVLYYGDEIGMGDNIYLGDRNSVRTPMQWSADRNAGFSRANPQKLYLPVIIDPEYHFEAINVEAQQNNPNSILWWTKRLIALRKRYKAFGRGSFELLHPESRKILAFVRQYEDECILVMANLSRFVQHFELDLSRWEGSVPVELFGRTPLPPIRSSPYPFMLGPHSFCWFSLEGRGSVGSNGEAARTVADLPAVIVVSNWEEVFSPPAQHQLEQVLPTFLLQRRWFGSKARGIKGVVVQSAIRVSFAQSAAYLTLIEVDFNEGSAESYVLPLAFAPLEPDSPLPSLPAGFAVARLTGGVEGLLYDALGSAVFCSAILEGIAQGEVLEASGGATLSLSSYAAFEPFRAMDLNTLAPNINRSEQSNTSVSFGNQLILKVFRRIDEGTNPDLEIGRYLTEQVDFPHRAAVVGAIEFRRRRKAAPTTLAVLHAYVPNEGDAWQYTLDALSSFYERAQTAPIDDARTLPTRTSLVDLAAADTPAGVRERVNTYLESAWSLGRRTAELHLALASATENPDFVPEPFGSLYQRSIYQSVRNLKGQVFHQLQQCLADLPEAVRQQARQILDQEDRVLHCIERLRDRKITALRTRVHGDYHLGQLLYTGKDFIILDFEGEPMRSVSDRRIKRSPLRDVAGMVRSFHYAAMSALYGFATARGQVSGIIRPEDRAVLEPWASYWYHWVSATFVKSYLETTGTAPFIPQSRDELRIIFEAFLLEKAIYELGYELNHRPDWVKIPVRGILDLIMAPECLGQADPSRDQA